MHKIIEINYTVVDPISTLNEYLNTVFDDVVILGRSCRNNALPRSPRQKRQYVAIISLHVKSLSLHEEICYLQIASSNRKIITLIVRRPLVIVRVKMCSLFAISWSECELASPGAKKSTHLWLGLQYSWERMTLPMMPPTWRKNGLRARKLALRPRKQTKSTHLCRPPYYSRGGEEGQRAYSPERMTLSMLPNTLTEKIDSTKGCGPTTANRFFAWPRRKRDREQLIRDWHTVWKWRHRTIWVAILSWKLSCANLSKK